MILITGGLGTIGRALHKELQGRGERVMALDLVHQPRQVGWRVSDGEADYVRCDVANFRQLERVFRECGPFDLVYHCAAEFGRWNGEDYYEQLWRTNATGTKNVIRLQERHRFRLVHFSSSEVYGDYDGVMCEAVMDSQPVRQLNDYAISKWVNETQIRNSMVQHATETVIVRLFNTYGPGEYYSPYRSVNCRFLYCALHGIPWTVRRGHIRTSTYIEDTVATLAQISREFHPGEVYNIGGGESHTIEQLSATVLEVTDADPAMVTFCEAEPQTTVIKHPDISKAVQQLGHRNTVTLRVGMERTANWMREVYR